LAREVVKMVVVVVSVPEEMMAVTDLPFMKS
jgi:hypothetical protein